MNILIINGVNMNMLGTREPEKYGSMTLKDLEKELYAYSFELGVDIETYQSNHEGEIVEKIQQAKNQFDGIIINAAAYTHTSVAIRDAISAVNIPTVEVHISNVHAREEFRKESKTAPACIGQICGFGEKGYVLAMEALEDYIIKFGSII